MRESIMPLLEAERLQTTFINEAFNNLNEINENQARLLGFTPEKVVIMKEKNGPYFVEFANNLERLMVENEMDLEHAITSLEEMYSINRRSINIVLRESDIGKLDIENLKDKFNLCKYTE